MNNVWDKPKLLRRPKSIMKTILAGVILILGMFFSLLSILETGETNITTENIVGEINSSLIAVLMLYIIIKLILIIVFKKELVNKFLIFSIIYFIVSFFAFVL